MFLNRDEHFHAILMFTFESLKMKGKLYLILAYEIPKRAQSILTMYNMVSFPIRYNGLFSNQMVSL